MTIINNQANPTYNYGTKNPSFVNGVPLYLLQDEFTTPLAAGAVNGTAAGPGPRVVVDTGGRLSLSGGLLTISAGGTWDDPKLYYSTTYARTPGLILVTRINPVEQGYQELGFSPSTTFLNNMSTSILFNSFHRNITILDTFAVMVNLTSSSTNNVYYNLAIALRASGAFYFVNGNEFTNWTLVYIGDLSTASPLYVGCPENTESTLIDFLRIPTFKWLPTPLASDGFGSAFGTTDGKGHAEGVAGGIGAGGGGLTWTGATWATSGGTVHNTPNKGTEKVSDTGFASAPDWTDSGTTFVVAGGVATGTLSSDTLTNTSGVAAVVGTWYVMTGTFTVTAGSVQMGMGGANGQAITTSGTYTQTVRATTTGKEVLTGAGFTGTVDDFSVKPLTLAELFATVDVGHPDVSVSANLTIPDSAQKGLVLNLDSTTNPQNFVQAHYTRSTGEVMLIKMVGGTYAADILNVTAAYSAGATLRIRRTKDNIYYVFYNNVYIGSATISDAGIIANTKHGLFATTPTSGITPFSVYGEPNADGSYNPYGILDAL